MMTDGTYSSTQMKRIARTRIPVQGQRTKEKDDTLSPSPSLLPSSLLFFPSVPVPLFFPFNRINYISTADGRRRLDSSSSPPVAVWVYHTRSFHKPSLNLPSHFFYEQSAIYYTSVDMCFVFLFAFVVCRLCAGCRYMRCLCIRACPLQYFSIEWA